MVPLQGLRELFLVPPDPLSNLIVPPDPLSTPSAYSLERVEQGIMEPVQLAPADPSRYYAFTITINWMMWTILLWRIPLPETAKNHGLTMPSKERYLCTMRTLLRLAQSADLPLWRYSYTDSTPKGDLWSDSILFAGGDEEYPSALAAQQAALSQAIAAWRKYGRDT